MAIDVLMPQMGESVVEGTILKWLVKEGDRVAEDQPLVEISTDKVDTEVPSPGAGVIARLLAEEGQTLPVGTKIALIEAGGATAERTREAASAPLRSVSAPTPSASAPEPRSPRPIAQPDTAAALRAARPAPAASPRPVAAPAPRPTGAPRRYSPVVLQMAEERGIDLNAVKGTGIEGRVSKRDLLNYLEGHEGGKPAATPAATTAAAVRAPAERPAAAPTPAPAGSVFKPQLYQAREGDQVEAFSRRRKLIAEHMVFSKTHSPHVPTVAEVDMTRVVQLRAQHKTAFAEHEGFALTILPFVAAATIRALKEFPRMNAAVNGDNLIIRKQINLGIAVDTDDGLLVPVIKDANERSVTELAREIERLHKRVVERKITPDELSGGSFTLSNPGREGNLYGFAIINQPQLGILRMGEIKKRPVVTEIDGEEAIAIRTMMYLALSYDHRAIDGVLGNRFLYRTGKILEECAFEL